MKISTPAALGLPTIMIALVLLSGVNVEAWVTTIEKTTCRERRCHSSSYLSLQAATEQRQHQTGTYDGVINPLVESIKPSKTVEIFSLVKQMEADGIEVTSLCVGEPDFLPPKVVLDAAIDAISRGQTRYTALTGTIELRQAIAEDLQRRKGVSYDPKTEIVVGNGAKQCVYQGVLATVGVGDQVLVPAPYWPSYPEMVRLAGAEPIILETSLDNGFLVTADQLKRTLDDHPAIKLIILCNPSNPTGGVYSEQHLRELCAILQDYPHVQVLADEIYERLVYSDTGECPSVAAQPGMWHRTMTINGFSKAYAMTGMRLGYLAAPKPIAKAVTTIQSQLTSCAGSISQAAGVAALKRVPESTMQDNLAIMKEKRDYVLDKLAAMPNVRVKVSPAGAFYVLPDVSAYGDDSALCMELLKEKQLALVPGSSLGAPGTVRISYATNLEELAKAMDKLRSFLEERAPE